MASKTDIDQARTKLFLQLAEEYLRDNQDRLIEILVRVYLAYDLPIEHKIMETVFESFDIGFAEALSAVSKGDINIHEIVVEKAEQE